MAIKLDVTVIGSSRCLGDAINAHELGDKISARLTEMYPVNAACSTYLYVNVSWRLLPATWEFAYKLRATDHVLFVHLAKSNQYSNSEDCLT